MKESPETIRYQIPFLPFERNLLVDLTKVSTYLDASTGAGSDQLKAEVFFSWSWADTVVRTFQSCFEEEAIQDDYDSDPRRAQDDFILMLRDDHRTKKMYYRVQSLIDGNPDFVDKFCKIPRPKIEFVTAPEDEQAWRILLSVTTHYRLHLSPKEEHGRQGGRFDVEHVVHAFRLHSMLPSNRELIERELLVNEQFQRLYNLQLRDEAERNLNTSNLACCGGKGVVLEIHHRERLQQKLDLISRSPPVPIGDDICSDEYIEFELRLGAISSKIEDPRCYLRMIEHSELNEVHRGDFGTIARQLEDPISLEYRPLQEGSSKFMLWRPPNRHPFDSNLLRTEDEVLEYCLANSWTFPGHTTPGGEVFFRATKLEESRFLENLQDYWKFWNDCALTLCPQTKKLYLLETLPGIQFRGRVSLQDEKSALTYFRNLVEARNSGINPSERLREIFGNDDSSTRYEYTLPFLQPDTVSLNSSQPFGRGQNGVVYRGVWRPPHTRLLSMQPEERQIDVVFKTISPRHDSYYTKSRLIAEISTTYTALAGFITGCVNFHGITMIRSGTVTMDGTLFDHQAEPRDTVVLVFGLANEGNVIDFLRRKLGSELSFESSFETINNALSGISNGLKSIHRHGVIHRDLHLNNVLVHQWTIPHDPELPSEYRTLLTDLGEAQLANSVVLMASEEQIEVGAAYFRAPEIRSRGWSTAADVFAFGLLICCLLEYRNVQCANAPSQELLDETFGDDVIPKKPLILPSKIKDMVMRCLKLEPDDRSAIGEVILIIDSLSRDFSDERRTPGTKCVKWELWDHWAHVVSIRESAGVPEHFSTQGTRSTMGTLTSHIS